MRVGVLGATGFVGTNLVQALATANIETRLASRRLGVDASDTAAVASWLRTWRITHLINLAADCGGIGLNAAKPADLWMSTAAISAAVTRAVATVGLDKFIAIGTVCSYAATNPVPFSEGTLMYYGPPEPTNRAYGVAKLSALYGAIALRDQYDIDVTCLIPTNLYGPHDHFDLERSHVIPALIAKFDAAAAAGDRTVTLWGDGTQTRDFLYVDDFCQAVIAALTHNTRTMAVPIINLGTANDITIRDVATIVANAFRYAGEIVWDNKAPGGQQRRRVSHFLASQVLGWQPTTSFYDGLNATIQWYRTWRTTAKSVATAGGV